MSRVSKSLCRLLPSLIASAALLALACSAAPPAEPDAGPDDPDDPGKPDDGSGGVGGLELSDPVPAPDVKVAALDRLGIPYEATRRAIIGDAAKKSVVDVTFPELDEAQLAAVRDAYGNVSDVRYSAAAQGRYRLSDFLWPVAQAAIDQNIPYQSRDIDGLPANFSLQTNCWSTVYEVFRADPASLRIFQNSVDTVLDWFDDPAFWMSPAVWSEAPRAFGEDELVARIESLDLGDVVIASDCHDPQELYCEAVHAAVVVDRGLLFERTGGSTATDVYRLVAMQDFLDLWYYPERRFHARRRSSAEPLPEPRWVLDYTQMTEGWHTFFLERTMRYQADPETGVRRLDRNAVASPIDPPPLAFEDLVGGEFGAPVDQLQEILALTRDGALAGCGNQRFCPEEPLTRAQLVHMVGGALEAASDGTIVMPAEATDPYFEDVAASDWFAPRVQWAREAGLITGASPTFRPHDPVSRVEMIIIMEGALRHFTRVEPGATDPIDPRLATSYEDISGHWGEDRIAGMTAYCRIAYPRLLEEGTFEPASATTRADAARALYRLRACLGAAAR